MSVARVWSSLTVKLRKTAPPTVNESTRYSGKPSGPPVRASFNSAASFGDSVANSAPVSIAKRYGP